jgi:hypothetical protein
LLVQRVSAGGQVAHVAAKLQSGRVNGDEWGWRRWLRRAELGCGTGLRGRAVAPVLSDPCASNDLLEALIDNGRLDPGVVIDHEAPQAAAVETYVAVGERQFVKVVLRP